MLRASANTGFRAPSIMDIQNPTPEVRTQLMDDPVLCPSPTPTVTNTGTPVAGFTRDQVCNVQTNYWTKSPDNSHLKPEKSKGWTVGLALEPTKGLLMTADYWGIKLTDMLGAVAIAEVQQQPAKYATNIIRKADGTIDYIVASQANRGDTRIRGPGPVDGLPRGHTRRPGQLHAGWHLLRELPLHGREGGRGAE